MADTHGATVTDSRDGATRVQAPDGFYALAGKLLLDVVVATLLLVVLLPVLAAIALAVRVTLGKPVIYRQTRVGYGSKTFQVLKFRTMHQDRRCAPTIRVAPVEERRHAHKTEDDPRHTTLGRLLRRASLDELPQLVNVVRGEMSLVGPRPEMVEVVQRYDTWQHQRHLVRPGITGLWQVTKRGDVPMQEAVGTDLDYIRKFGLWTDLKLIALTVPALVRHHGT